MMFDYMLTFTGAVYRPTHPRVEDVRIVDIAHHLSNCCRYSGACRRFYSVAEHSVLVSHVVPPEHALQGLLHDATEAYLHDITRALKYSWLMWGYRVLEARNWRVIAERFGVPVLMHREVKDADDAVLLAERLALMPASPVWQVSPRDAADVKVIGHPPELAEEYFLNRFYDLTRGRPLEIKCRRNRQPLVSLEGCAV